MRIVFTILLVVVLELPLAAQEITSVPALPGVRVMPRVDTTHAEVRLILRAWIDSLAVWRQAALGVGSEPNRSGLAGMPDGVVKNWFAQSAEVVTSFPPTILSIEPENDHWVIRTLFSATDVVSHHIVPLGILQTSFGKGSEGGWVVENPLLLRTEDWEEYATSRIRFVFAGSYSIDKTRARAASDFVVSTARTFRLEPPNSVTFYITTSRDAMCALLGIEYYSFPPSGLSYPAEKIILSGIGDAWYPHELVHVVFRDYDDAHPVVREGVATWLGGSLGTEFDVLLRQYVAAKRPDEVPSFIRLFTDPYLAQDDVYILGAALCKAVYDKGGPEAVLGLLRSHDTSEAMLYITRVLGIEPSDTSENLLPLLTQLLEPAGVDAGR